VHFLGVNSSGDSTDTGTGQSVDTCNDSITSNEISCIVNDESAGNTGSNTNYVNAQDSDPTPSPRFTLAEELKYSRRYEEGYDLLDPCYEEWL